VTLAAFSPLYTWWLLAVAVLVFIVKVICPRILRRQNPPIKWQAPTPASIDWTLHWDHLGYFKITPSDWTPAPWPPPKGYTISAAAAAWTPPRLSMSVQIAGHLDRQRLLDKWSAPDPSTRVA
jgi:hypothetical protein